MEPGASFSPLCWGHPRASMPCPPCHPGVPLGTPALPWAPPGLNKPSQEGFPPACTTSRSSGMFFLGQSPLPVPCPWLSGSSSPVATELIAALPFVGCSLPEAVWLPSWKWRSRSTGDVGKHTAWRSLLLGEHCRAALLALLPHHTHPALKQPLLITWAGLSIHLR